MRAKSTVKSDPAIRFYRNLLTARFFEGLVGAILELSGYEVYPYGYETLMPALRTQFRKNHSSTPAPTEARLRSSPDLLVIDPGAPGDAVSTRLVEVKFRNWASPQDVRLTDMRWYQHYWPDAVLVLIIPGGEFFYAQEVKKLDAGQRQFDLTKEFRLLPELFGRVRPEVLAVFQKDVVRFAEGGDR